MTEAHRLQLSFGASVLAHLAALGLLLRVTPAPAPPTATLIPIALVGRLGGGGGTAGPPAAPATPAPAQAPARSPLARAAPTRPAHTAPARPTRRSAPPATAPAPSAPSLDAGAATAGASGSGAGGPGGAGSGQGGGDGSGGDGSGGARVAYGENPLPPYPLAARRLAQEGVVLLDVLVAPDGSAADVRVLRSSGFPLLDDSALATVRRRWRFVPARRDGRPVESRVRVPIRFRLADARG